MPIKILTVPEVIEEREIYYPVGNEWVALPEITAGGGLESFNVLKEANKGMLEIRGGKTPLLEPSLKVSGREFEFKEAKWRRLEDWIPQFELVKKGLKVVGTIFCPNDFRGFVYLLEVANTTKETLSLELGFCGNWQSTAFTVYRSRHSTGDNIAWYNRWTRTLSFEHRSGLPDAAWSLGLSKPLGEFDWQIGGQSTEEEISRKAGQDLTFSVSEEISLKAGADYQLALYVGVNNEADGAGTCTVDLQRHGWRNLLKRHRRWLKEHLAVPNADGDYLRSLCNLNAFFNYFFARGKCLDTENTVLMTTRSPRYYVSAAFWARDAYLWSFPSLLKTDAKAAREALWVGAKTYWPRIAEHSLYIDGTELYPGFELDEQAAWVIALSQYLSETADWTIVEDVGADLFGDYLNTLQEWYGPNGLYATFLSPTDDPVKYPYLTYDNVLVWRSFLILADVYEHFGEGEKAGKLTAKAARLRQDIQKHCIRQGPRGLMYAWSVGENGEYEILDQPPGSLQLLEYYGFCKKDDEVYQNTVRTIHSRANPDYAATGTFQAPACEHAPFPWVLSLAYELLNGDRKRALKLFEKAPLDNGIACETIDADTGWVKTGAAFATCAGFLAHSLAVALQESE